MYTCIFAQCVSTQMSIIGRRYISFEFVSIILTHLHNRRVHRLFCDQISLSTFVWSKWHERISVNTRWVCVCTRWNRSMNEEEKIILKLQLLHPKWFFYRYFNSFSSNKIRCLCSIFWVLFAVFFSSYFISFSIFSACWGSDAA